MKKAIGIAVLAALIVSLSGCANTDHPQTIQDSSSIEVVTNEVDERTEPEESSSTSVSESNESSADSTATVKAETETAQAENSQPTTEESPAAGTQTPSPQTVVPPDTPKTVEPTLEPKPTQPTPPHAEEKSTPEPATTELPPDEPAVPEFNIQTWIDYAKAYAVNVGLRLESTAVDCWDNPITASAYSTCLERDIQSRLDRYSRDEDITDVWIWAEKRSDGSYDLYIGYA